MVQKWGQDHRRYSVKLCQFGTICKLDIFIAYLIMDSYRERNINNHKTWSTYFHPVYWSIQISNVSSGYQIFFFFSFVLKLIYQINVAESHSYWLFWWWFICCLWTSCICEFCDFVFASWISYVCVLFFPTRFVESFMFYIKIILISFLIIHYVH